MKCCSHTVGPVAALQLAERIAQRGAVPVGPHPRQVDVDAVGVAAVALVVGLAAFPPGDRGVHGAAGVTARPLALDSHIGHAQPHVIPHGQLDGAPVLGLRARHGQMGVDPAAQGLGLRVEDLLRQPPVAAAGAGAAGEAGGTGAGGRRGAWNRDGARSGRQDRGREERTWLL